MFETVSGVTSGSSPVDNLYFRPIFFGETESMIAKTNFTPGPNKKSLCWMKRVSDLVTS